LEDSALELHFVGVPMRLPWLLYPNVAIQLLPTFAGYLACSWFSSWSGHRLSWLIFVLYVSLLSNMATDLGTLNWPPPHPFKCFVTRNSLSHVLLESYRAIL